VCELSQQRSECGLAPSTTSAVLAMVDEVLHFTALRGRHHRLSAIEEAFEERFDVSKAINGRFRSTTKES
jgi:hypothetical protein